MNIQFSLGGKSVAALNEAERYAILCWLAAYMMFPQSEVERDRIVAAAQFLRTQKIVDKQGLFAKSGFGSLGMLPSDSAKLVKWIVRQHLNQRASKEQSAERRSRIYATRIFVTLMRMQSAAEKPGADEFGRGPSLNKAIHVLEARPVAEGKKSIRRGTLRKHWDRYGGVVHISHVFRRAQKKIRVKTGKSPTLRTLLRTLARDEKEWSKELGRMLFAQKALDDFKSWSRGPGLVPENKIWRLPSLPGLQLKKIAWKDLNDTDLRNLRDYKALRS